MFPVLNSALHLSERSATQWRFLWGWLWLRRIRCKQKTGLPPVGEGKPTGAHPWKRPSGHIEGKRRQNRDLSGLALQEHLGDARSLAEVGVDLDHRRLAFNRLSNEVERRSWMFCVDAVALFAVETAIEPALLSLRPVNR